MSSDLIVSASWISHQHKGVQHRLPYNASYGDIPMLK